ncbi:hypothetical protein CLV56_2567 [Mumia flava]|uniref:Uncharacterized protein n=1 Tax=Mumia flava TaxID=1348852 RepID=A0A2M9BK39_9ACTN|nr:hypothetical protein [Mumia flava]PJJ58316.1 hypothetical protein CLV56_2567 [Mumia flava]
MRRTTSLRAAVAACALGAVALSTVAAVWSPVSALPPGGASPDTAGTSSSVSPSRLRAGDVIRFTVSGFPAGEIVSIKIDDGEACSQQAVHGACVYHQQKISASGTASGSFVLPGDLPAGEHWLRYLASAEMLDEDGNYLGVKGFSNRGGSTFTVVAAPGGSGAEAGSSGGGGAAAGSSTGGSAASGSSASSDGSGSGSASGSGAGTAAATTGDASSSALGSGVVTIEPTATPTSAATAEPSTAPEPASTPVVAAAGTDASDDFPVVGTVGFVALLVLAAVLWTWSLRRAGPSSPHRGP